MILPYRGTYLCEVLGRHRQLASGLWLADRIKSEDKKDNVCRCLGVGDPLVGKKGKVIPTVARRTDIIHYKQNFGKKFEWEGKRLISLKTDEIIAIEREEKVLAVGSMVITKLQYAEKMGSFYVPDNAKQNSGDFTGEVVSVGPDYPDKSLRVGNRIIYLRGEGYKFRTYETRVELRAVKEVWIYGKKS